MINRRDAFIYSLRTRKLLFCLMRETTLLTREFNSDFNTWHSNSSVTHPKQMKIHKRERIIVTQLKHRLFYSRLQATVVKKYKTQHYSRFKIIRYFSKRIAVF